MSEPPSSSSKTDWERIDAMADDEIDVSDSPPLSEDFFSKAKWLMPGESASRQTVRVEIDLEDIGLVSISRAGL